MYTKGHHAMSTIWLWWYNSSWCRFTYAHVRNISAL